MDRLPDFFLVGASKAGTTYICEALASHPDICFSEKKEPNFFSDFDINLEEIPSEKLLRYQRLFHIQNPKQILGEGSVKYLNSPNAAYWINRYIPSAKIVIILRNPIQRVVSLYEMYTRLGNMQMSPDQAFSVSSYVVKQCLMYEKIMLYINTFSQDQVLVMIFDDFLKNQDQAFRRLCQYIGVEKAPRILPKVRNKGGVPKSSFLKFINNRNLIEKAKKLVPNSKHSQVDYSIKSMFFKKIRLKPTQREELQSFFYDDVKKISTLIDLDLCQEWQLCGDSNTTNRSTRS